MPYAYVKSGNRFNYFILTGDFKRDKRGTRIYECICECGEKRYLLLSQLTTGNTKSCGCKQGELISKNSFIHGLSRNWKDGKRHPLYAVWNGIKNRCYCKNNSSYKDYGGRGIIMCDEWKNNPVKFINWAIGEGWEKGLTIDRKKCNGNYEPLNCRVATQKEQNRNKRRSLMITAFGETKNVVDWVEDKRCSVSRYALYDRVKRLNWDSEKAILTKPCRIRKVNAV